MPRWLFQPKCDDDCWYILLLCFDCFALTILPLCVRFCLLAGVHANPINDSVRHTSGRPDDVWAEANSFFGHDKKHQAMARQEIKNSQGKHLSFHSAAYRKSFFFTYSRVTILFG